MSKSEALRIAKALAGAAAITGDSKLQLLADSLVAYISGDDPCAIEGSRIRALKSARMKRWRRRFPEKRRSAVERFRVFERDGWACRYCADPITMESGHADHVMPRSRGGSDDIKNLAASCAPCNKRKGARTPEEWLQ